MAEYTKYRFTPQPDISAFNLAKLLASARCLLGGETEDHSIMFTEAEFDALGESRRHFTLIQE